MLLAVTSGGFGSTVKAGLTGALRWFLLRTVGEYDVWRIYSIDTVNCCLPKDELDIRTIHDVTIFDMAGLEAEMRRANWFRPGATGYAAWQGERLAGVCWLWPGPLLGERNIGLQKNDCADLIQITVASWARGMSIGPKLIMHAGCGMRRLGYRRLYAQIWRSNTASMKAFQKAGWEQVAWFLQLKLRIFPKPLRLRRIAARFRTAAGVLESWKAAQA